MGYYALLKQREEDQKLSVPSGSDFLKLIFGMIASRSAAQKPRGSFSCSSMYLKQDTV